MCGERGRRLRIACFVAAPAPSRNSLPLLSESDCFVGRMARQVPMSAADRTGGRGQGPSYTREPAQGVAVGSTASCRKLVGAEASHMSPMRTFHEEEAKAVGGGAPVQAERHVLRDKLLHWVGHDAAALWSVCSPEGKRVDPADLPRRMTNAGLSLGPREVEQLHRLMPPSSADGMIGWDEWVVVFGEGSGARCGGGVAMATATPAHAAAGMSTHQLGVPHTFPHRGENANEPPPMHPPTLAGAASSLPPYPQVTSESPFKPAPPVSEEAIRAAQGQYAGVRPRDRDFLAEDGPPAAPPTYPLGVSPSFAPGVPYPEVTKESPCKPRPIPKGLTPDAASAHETHPGGGCPAAAVSQAGGWESTIVTETHQLIDE